MSGQLSIILELSFYQMTFLLNGKPVDALALILHRSVEQEVGRMWVKKLRQWMILQYYLPVLI